MEKFYKIFTIVAISITIIFGVLSFTVDSNTPEPKPSTVRIANGDGFIVYRVSYGGKLLYVAKSTNSNPVAITE